MQIHDMHAIFYTEPCTFTKGAARGSPFMMQHEKKTCLHLTFSHTMALKLDANVFQYEMNVYTGNENLIFASQCLLNMAARSTWSHFEACDQ